MSLRDAYGRSINYLRLSVTDRCNLRCTYCMPADGITRLQHADMLSYEELLHIAKAAVAIGVEKIRITGGEPLVRQGIIGFLDRLARIPGLKRLVVTTNGILLPEMAHDLRCVGVESLNISLDSLRTETFAAITRGGDVRRVLAGIEAAEQAGFPFVKINVVVMRRVNDDELMDFAALTIDKPFQVRFIEYMPTLKDKNWQELSMSGAEILERLSQRFLLQPVKKETMAGPAAYYRIPGARGMVGVITPVSCHFCHECNRIRVTSAGVAKSCLFASKTFDLKQIVRTGDRHALRDALRCVVNDKPERHNISDPDHHHAILAMSQVGG